MDVHVVSENITSPVGLTARDNFDALLNNISGVKEQVFSPHPSQPAVPFYASLFSNAYYQEILSANNNTELTKFEQLLVYSISNALQGCRVDITDPAVIVIISSTKGNVSLLETGSLNDALKEDIGLPASAKKIAGWFGLAHTPIIISNACISGLTALLTGKRLLETGRYKHAVVAGADIITAFIASGFQSFQAISQAACKPFDANRKGINLGEAAATVVLSTELNEQEIRLTGGAVTNDANHISGPSRSGQELCMAIGKAMKQANVNAADIGFISAHGTATVYNDEMEAKAFSLAGMETIPLNSLKGYYGHTLGAAGLVESVIALHSMRQRTIIATRGFEKSGVSVPVNVCKENTAVTTNHFLKTASGFGGCNAALVFSKTNH